MSTEYKTSAEPRAMIGEVPVFCTFDELLPVEKVVGNPRNPNTHSKKQVEMLAKIITATGWRANITISRLSGYVVKGHGRLAAAIKAGLDKVPVEYQNYTSEAEEWADLTADNRIAELADMNNTMLADLLAEIDTGEFPLELTGYTEEDLEGIIGAIAGEDDAEPNDQDNEKEQKVMPLSRPGDLWILGNNRLLCGDATKAEDFERLMNGEKAALVSTDPPYGVSYVSQSQKFEMIQNDDKTHDELYAKLLVPSFKNLVRHAEANAAFYIWHASSTRRDFEDAMTAAGLMENQYITWVKNGFTLGRSDYQWGTEYCFYASRAGERPHFYGDRAQNTAWRVTARKDGAMATTLGNGLVITDGAGAKLYVTDQPPKGKKLRYLRTHEGAPVELYSENKATTAWEVARETGALHPCLPAGQKVYFNNEWKNIEDVKVGDTNRYGSVIATTEHTAERIVEIKTGDRTTIATWNHPFLVRKEDGLYWINAEHIKEGDKLVDVCQKSTKQQPRDITGTDPMAKEQEWNMTSSGKNTTDQSQKECKSTIETETKQTMTYPISNLSVPLNTNGYTKVVSNEEMSGSNLAKSAENTNHAPKKTGTSVEDGSTEKFAENATSRNKSKTEDAELLTVGSVRIIEKPTTVYNLTMSDIPAFDTEVGLSHNTQKPLELITIAIENSSKPEEIVLDCFGGSGSALIAADKAGRRGYAIELSPHYVDVIVTRYLLSTGNLGITVIRNGQEIPYMKVLEPWMEEQGVREEVMSLRTPVPVFSAKQVSEEEAVANE